MSRYVKLTRFFGSFVGSSISLVRSSSCSPLSSISLLVSIVCILHTTHVALANTLVIDNGFWIILSNNDAAFLLYLQRSIPRLVNELLWEIFELRQPFANIIAVWVGLFPKGDGTVASKILIEVGCAGQPLNDREMILLDHKSE